MKVEKYTLFKVRHDLLNIKDTKSIHLQGTIDLKKQRKKMFLNFQDLKTNVLIFG